MHNLTEFPKDIRFKYSWRKYQQRVLDDLQTHLNDGHLHVIAPPGSGKTVLGLEVAIRLNHPTLILTPSLAIRNQWIQRFCELFLQTNHTPDWISKDIRNPGFMTVVTYQGLHAACNNLWVKEEENGVEMEEETTEEVADKTTNPNLDNIVCGLLAQNVKTIVVDEAHHLKNGWWQTLNKVKNKLEPFIVGLTATPPYDVTPAEWQRYLDLNGPVDTEISVPELVIEGDLCPHQDYIHFTAPTVWERNNIREFRQRIGLLFEEIKGDATIIEAIENHPIWQNPYEHLEWIYNNLAYYSASLIFLNANNVEIPYAHLDVIDGIDREIPPFDYHWMEILLDFYLYKEKEHFKTHGAHQKELESKLRRSGAIENRQINFSYNKQIANNLTSSISKLNGIQQIVDFEYQQLGNDLRMVILTDYIRKEFFVQTPENNVELNKIGTIPIFEQLRRTNIHNKKIGVLTGSLIIIPSSAYAAFETLAATYGIRQMNTMPVPYDDQYVVIHQTEAIKNEVVHIVTQIFQDGAIEVLIGTKSLLGEGWDAPAINSLVLASFVGSFVLSNQMRGRAIRTQRGNAGKTGNIWHLVTIDETSPTGGHDFDVLKRRFKSFVGLSFDEIPKIENGIGRLNLPENMHTNDEVAQINAKMLACAGNRETLKETWRKALESGVTLVEEIKIPFREKKEYKATKSMYFNKTIKYLLLTLAGIPLAFIKVFLKKINEFNTVQDLYYFLAISGALIVLTSGRQAIKTLLIYIKYRDIGKDINQIGHALTDTLISAGVIQTEHSKLKITTSMNDAGVVYCHLEGGTTFEKSTFIQTLREVIQPVDNPRYVIVRKNIMSLFPKEDDYHAVPEIIGRNKHLAEFFKKQWERQVGRCELVFTRTIEGRKLLLKARVKSLAAQLNDTVESVNKWV